MSESVKAWQRALGVTADGDFGPHTLAASLALLPAQTGAGPEPDRSRGDQLPWIAEGLKVLGLHETRDNAALRAWLKSDGKTLGDPSALPWCGDYVETCIKAALPFEPFIGALATNPYFARNWGTFGESCILAYGCIVVFERGPNSGHVGFAVGQDADNIYVLGGNQGDAVSVVRIAHHRLLATRWPVTWTGDPQPCPAMTPGTIPTSVNEF